MCSCMLISRYESLLKATDPIPLYALKLLVSMTEHSTHICRYCYCISKTMLLLFLWSGNTVQYTIEFMINSINYSGKCYYAEQGYMFMA